MSENSFLALPDSEARERAVLIDSHAFVWASAGTGKTHTLTLRALHLLLNAPFLPPVRPVVPGTDHLAPIAKLYSAERRDERVKAARLAIGSLVLTTFTRKAAAEMQSRLYRYLDLLASSPTWQDLEQQSELGQGVKDTLFLRVCERVLAEIGAGALTEQESFSRLRAGAEALAELAFELQISTIHSLALAILRRHPLAAALPPDVRFADEDDPDSAGMEDELISRWWQLRALRDPRIQEDLKTALPLATTYQLRNWLRELYRNPCLLREFEQYEQIGEEEATQLVAAVQGLIGRLQKLSGTRQAAVREGLERIVSKAANGDPTAWSELCAFATEHKKSLFLDLGPTKGVREAIDELPPTQARFFGSLPDLCQPALRLALSRLYPDEWSAWKRVLGEFSDWSRRGVLEELGFVDFDQMIRLAADLLQTDEEVRRHEHNRLRALLVDEFQDTDPDQLRLLEALLSRDHQSPHEPLGFFVGDVKQSIYRFRGVEVRSTEQFARQFEALTGCRIACEKGLHLTTSFRSRPSITGLVNNLFSRFRMVPLGRTSGRPDEADRTRPFCEKQDELVPLRTDQAGVPELICLETDQDGSSFLAGRGRELAALETLRCIREHHAKEGARFSDILVLVRSAKELDAVLGVLLEAGIPVLSSGAKNLYRQAEVLDLLNLLIALHNPLDTLAVGAVLRSPLVQVSDRTIHALLQAVPAKRLFHFNDPPPDMLPPEAIERIERLRELARLRASAALSDWLLEVRRFVPVAAYTDTRDLEGRAFARMNKLFDSFGAQVTASNTPPLVWLLNQRARAAEVQRGDDNDFGEDVTISDETIDAVRLMTIHKAKGLEARVVIVPSWAPLMNSIKSPKGSNRKPFLCYTTDQTEPPAFSLPWGPITVSSPSFCAVQQAEEERNREEAIRLAYVATTRARDQLILIHAASKTVAVPDEMVALRAENEKAPWESDAAVPVGDSVPPENRVLNVISKEGAARLDEQEKTDECRTNRESYGQLWAMRHKEARAELRRLLARPASESIDKVETDERDDRRLAASTKPDVALHAGSIVHRYLERFLVDEAFDPAKLNRVATEFPGADAQARQRAAGLLDRFYRNEIPGNGTRKYRQRCAAATILAQEFPFFLDYEGRGWNGVVDLVIEEDNSIVGVDYKTTSEKADLPESYEQQRRIYTEALRRIFPGRKVGFEFWWLE